MRYCSTLLIIVLCFSFVSATAQIEGSWYADLKVQGARLPLVFHFSSTENENWFGSMDSPSQKVFNIPIDEVFVKGDSLSLSSKSLGIHFKGVIKEEQVNGIFQQSGFSIALDLTREPSKEIEESNRPQEPKAPFPYTTTEVQFFNAKDSIYLAGTLSYPKNAENYSIIVMISGSGAQDRNSEILGHKPFWVAADYFSRKGIAVLRFDDRGTAASEGDFGSATTVEFMEDAYAAVQFIKEQESLSVSKIGLYGHSEGGMIAPLLASTYPDAVDFLVLLAPPTLPIKDLVLKQQKDVSIAAGIDPETIQLNQNISLGAFQLVEEDTEQLAESLEVYFNTVSDEYPSLLENMGLSKTKYVETMVNAYTDPWMTYFLRFLPEQYLKDLHIPILALYGEKDIQVSAKENAQKMKSIIGKKNPKNEVITFPNLNHLFQNSKTGEVAEYAEIEETISEKLLLKVSDWVKSL